MGYYYPLRGKDKIFEKPLRSSNRFEDTTFYYFTNIWDLKYYMDRLTYKPTDDMFKFVGLYAPYRYWDKIPYTRLTYNKKYYRRLR